MIHLNYNENELSLQGTGFELQSNKKIKIKTSTATEKEEKVTMKRKKKEKEKKKKKKKTNSPGRDAGTSEEWKGQIVIYAKLNFSLCLLRAGCLGYWPGTCTAVCMYTHLHRHTPRILLVIAPSKYQGGVSCR